MRTPLRSLLGSCPEPSPGFASRCLWAPLPAWLAAELLLAWCWPLQNSSRSVWEPISCNMPACCLTWVGAACASLLGDELPNLAVDLGFQAVLLRLHHRGPGSAGHPQFRACMHACVHACVPASTAKHSQRQHLAARYFGGAPAHAHRRADQRSPAAAVGQLAPGTGRIGYSCK